MLFRELLSLGVILRDAAIGQPRQQIERLPCESVSQPQVVGQLRKFRRRFGAVLLAAVSAMHQKRGAAIGRRAQQSHAALRLVPILHHDVLQLVMQKLFGRPLVRRVDVHEVRQQAQRLETAIAFESAEQPLHRVRGIRPMRKNVFERVLARLLMRELRA